jgi:hypothetical protein
MTGLIPVGMDREKLADLLLDMSKRVREGDSLEGHLEYLVPDQHSVLDSTGWPSPDVDAWVTGAYRIGNLQGQGGMRLIGTVPRS